MVSTSAGAAEIIQSAICRTRIRGIHRPSPSVFYFPGLSSKPLYTKDTFRTISNHLQENHSVILKEYTNLRAFHSSSDYDIQTGEHKLHAGKWDWNSYILKGKRQADFAAKCPKTVEILESFGQPSLMSSTPFAFAFFSTLHGKTTIAPHFGPCNLRIRCHFPLVVPDGDCGMVVGGETVQWIEGSPIFFDDCYEHCVWNNTESARVVLLFDIWHPELQQPEIEAIEQMFGYAKQKGWLK